MADNIAHHSNWQKLGSGQIIDWFKKHFTKFGVLPDTIIAEKLRELKSATLECLEKRSTSTVYRIKQTGVVYQVCNSDRNRVTYQYESYDEYLLDGEVDDLVELYIIKQQVHIIKEVGGKKYLERKKPPRFIAEIEMENETSVLSNVKWIDNVTDASEIAKLMRKAGAFLSNYIKK